MASGLRARVRELASGRDAGLVYAGIVLAITVALGLLPGSVADRVVQDSSTNLVNLRRHPPFVLLVSAFVEPSGWDLWVVVPLVWAFGVLQRWLGRAAVLITATLGHVGVTVFVATFLTAGIVHGRVSLSEATATDVGVSYALVTVLGLISARLSRRLVRGYVVLLTLGLIAAVVLGRSFTDLGHLAAWVLGLGLAHLVRRAQSAGRADVRQGGAERGEGERAGND